MTVLRGVSLMGLGTLLRLGGAFLAFAVAARFLGPSAFGSLMYWVGVGALIGIVSNFGLPTYLLKEIAGKSNGEVARLLGKALMARIFITVPLLVLFVGVFVSVSSESWAVPFFVVLAMLIESVIEMLSAGFRAGDRFDLEARLSLWAALLYAISMVLVCITLGSVHYVALAMLLTRAAMLLVCLHQLAALVGKPVWPAPLAACQQLRTAVPYAIDSCLTASFGQVDSLVIGNYMSAAAVGMYQAGMRMFLAGAQLGSIFANVFIPNISRSAQQTDSLARSKRDVVGVQIAFLASGLAVGLGLTLAGPLVVKVAYGPSYVGLERLMPWFGVLFTVRFAAAAWGLLLTAHGLQKIRAWMSAIHWIFVLVTALYAMPVMGLQGWLLGLLLGNLFLMISYSSYCLRRGIGSVTILLSGVALIGIQIAIASATL